MSTKLIRLEDDTLIEVQAQPDEVEMISGGEARRIDEATFSKVKPYLLKVSQPVVEAWRELNSTSILVEEVEIQVGLSFETGGDIYIAKSQLGANLSVKMKLKSGS